MASPTLTQEPTDNWQRLALISLFGGFGFALALSLVLGAVVWFNARPRPPKPWDTTAIVAQRGPGFSIASAEKKGVELTYTLENKTDADYRIEYDAHPTILLRTNRGTFSEPIPDDAAFIKKPIFIPAKQKAFLTITLLIPGIPGRKPSDSDVQYHERLRGFLQEHFGSMASFAVFDGTNRYQINLLLWFPAKATTE